MCRHLAYLGPPVPLAALLVGPPHSLLHQSWAPRDMRGGGTINADGFGIGWYPSPGSAPVRYRRDRPIWTDEGLVQLAGVTVAGAMLAAVRSATPGMALAEAACAPFAEGAWLFSHNGVVAGWPDSVTAPARALPLSDLLTLDAPTDSALLWALVRHRLRAGAPPGDAIAATVSEVLTVAPGSRLNLLLCDGHRIVASACGHALSVRAADGAVTIASEPLDDDPRWREVPDGHLLIATTDTMDLRPLWSVGGPASTVERLTWGES